MAAGAGQDDHTRGRVRFDLVERQQKLAAHREVERVARVRAVQGDRRDGAGLIDDEFDDSLYRILADFRESLADFRSF